MARRLAWRSGLLNEAGILEDALDPGLLLLNEGRELV